MIVFAVATAISHAFAVLSDEQKRKDYDMYGEDDGRGASSAGAAFRQRYGSAEDISPEELFNMFFGMHSGAAFHGTAFGPGFRVYRQSFGGRPRQHRADDEDTQARRGPSMLLQLIQLLPLLLLFLTSFFSFSSYQEPAFSFEPTPKYPIQRFTESRGVVSDIPYYVQKSFNKDYGINPRALYKIEKSVEAEYESRLRYKCAQEKEKKRNMIYRCVSSICLPSVLSVCSPHWPC